MLGNALVFKTLCRRSKNALPNVSAVSFGNSFHSNSIIVVFYLIKDVSNNRLTGIGIHATCYMEFEFRIQKFSMTDLKVK